MIPGSERSPGEGNDYPLQYSCLKNSMDRGSRWATLHGVAKIRQAGEEDSGSCPGPKDRNAETYIYGEVDGPGFCHTESSQKEIHVSYINGYMWNLEKFV